MKKILPMLLAICLLSSCKQKENQNYLRTWTETWTVASRTYSTEEFPVVLWAKINDSEKWVLKYPPFVKGFNYEEGYEYRILVRAEQQEISELPADSPSILYYLVEILSKEQKESEGIY